jgi:hypothetical protein
VREACVLCQLVGDAPAAGRGAIATAVLVLVRDAPRTQVLDPSQERQRDLRKLVELFVSGHAARVRAGDAETGELRTLRSPDALSGSVSSYSRSTHSV